MIVTLLPTFILTISATAYPTPAGFNDNDYQKLVAFALQYDNLDKLGWDLSDPASWNEGSPNVVRTVIWNEETEKRVIHISIGHLALEGKLDISDFIALDALICVGNQLTEINVFNNSVLRHFDCSYNQLTALDVSSNIALELLTFGYNKLTEIDVSKNASLKHLCVSGNHFTEIDVSNNIELQSLNVVDNMFSELDVSKNLALKEIYVRNNQLIELNLLTNIALESLDISDNQLTDISSLENLQHLGANGYVSVCHNYLNLDCPDIQASIAKIKATVEGNGGTFIYTPQKDLPPYGFEPHLL
jgi:hypothetical protein